MKFLGEALTIAMLPQPCWGCSIFRVLCLRLVLTIMHHGSPEHLPPPHAMVFGLQIKPLIEKISCRRQQHGKMESCAVLREWWRSGLGVPCPIAAVYSPFAKTLHQRCPWLVLRKMLLQPLLWNPLQLPHQDRFALHIKDGLKELEFLHSQWEWSNGRLVEKSNSSTWPCNA